MLLFVETYIDGTTPRRQEVMTFNTEHVELKALDGSALALTDDFKCLGKVHT